MDLETSHLTLCVLEAQGQVACESAQGDRQQVLLREESVRVYHPGCAL